MGVPVTGVPSIPQPLGGGAAAHEPLTEDLLERLLAAPDADALPAETQTARRDLSAYLNGLLAIKGKRRIDVVHEARLSEPHGYQIFTGARSPGRDKALALCFALACTVREAQRLLWHSGNAHLYARNRRDAIILFALGHGYTLAEADETLWRLGEQTVQGVGK